VLLEVPWLDGGHLVSSLFVDTGRVVLAKDALGGPPAVRVASTPLRGDPPAEVAFEDATTYVKVDGTDEDGMSKSILKFGTVRPRLAYILGRKDVRTLAANGGGPCRPRHLRPEDPMRHCWLQPESYCRMVARGRQLAPAQWIA
jgi:hypothetical protein